MFLKVGLDCFNNSNVFFSRPPEFHTSRFVRYAVYSYETMSISYRVVQPKGNERTSKEQKYSSPYGTASEVTKLTS